MSTLYFMMTVADRKLLPGFVSLYKEQGLNAEYIFLGSSTAAQDVLNVLGIGSTEKAVIITFVTDGQWPGIRKLLERKMHIDVPGTGIAFIVPVSSIGGRRELAFLTGGNFEKGDESVLKDTKRELIVAICEQGHSETVMNAAREAGAGGGTIIHAQGTGMESAEKFLGVTLNSGKDIVLIVANTSAKAGIMSSVMKNAGLETAAKSVCFSLPVTDTAGLRLEDET